jgi:phosphoenolpyruvate mutase
MTKKVYMGFSTDVLHGGHMAIIQKAASLGELTIGMLSDEAIVSFKRFPILNYAERVKLVEAIKGVNTVVPQATLSYAENLRKYKPDIVVHGDNWKSGPQKAIRDEVIEILKEYGGELVETAYADNPAYEAFEAEQRKILSMPDQRRGRLKKLLEMKPLVSIMEAHSGITGLIVEKTIVTEEGKTHQFDGMWSSSLCDSTSKGKPDIELLDMSTRFRTLDEIMDVTTKPIIVDGDTGGQTEHFVYNIRTMERMGVSAVIIEDKTGLKKNSLFGTDVEQTQDSIENFSAKLKAGRAALKSNDFLLIARIESLILDKGMEDALERAFAFTKAGAHGIMIHSRKKDPSEIFEFCEKFRAVDKTSPLVVVPTSFNSVTEEEFAARGVNVVIYANQFTRSGFPAMKHVAETILSTHRAKEADDLCMSIKEILTLIPEEF